MSIKTTHIVTRKFAIEAIMKKMDELENLKDDELEDLLEEVIHNGFYNFSIVSEDEIEVNKTRAMCRPYLDSTYDIPSRNDAW